MSYHEDLQINENKLEIEWQEQPLKYKQYADAWADAENERVLSKSNLEQVSADIAKHHRNNPPVDDKGKPAKLTADALKELVTTDEKVIEATKHYNEATYNANILKNSKEAFEQRKKGLEKLVDLWGMKYFGTPKTTPQRTNTVEDNSGHSRPGLKKRR